MNFTELVLKVNKEIQKSKELKNFQRYRAKMRNGVVKNYQFFNYDEKFVEEESYSYHIGGSNEFQFNISAEPYYKGKPLFRFGLAFSLDPSQSVTDPVGERKPGIERFNQFIEEHPTFLQGRSLWLWENRKRKETEDIKKIDAKKIQRGNFIFIGKWFEKEVSELTDIDIQEIVAELEYLFPIYKLIQWGQKFHPKEKRIARIAFNTNDWKFPSGKTAKSSDKNSFENKNGFGFDEWLFDNEKLIDGYHYRFLEPIRKEQDAYKNNTFDVWLYTINGVSKKRYWVGEIYNLEVIDEAEAERVFQIYKENGWLEEMQNQVKAVNGNVDTFVHSKPLDVLNIRFKPSELIVKNPILELPSENLINNQSRYVFAHFKENSFIFVESNKYDFNEQNESSSKEEKKKSTEYERGARKVEVELLHNTISENLEKYLVSKYGRENVKNESRIGNSGRKVDIVVQDNSRIIFYEIKTNYSLRISIREALGQILEYTFWPDHINADEMIIVTQKNREIEEAKKYMKHLREKLNINIYYQYFDIENNTLSEKF